MHKVSNLGLSGKSSKRDYADPFRSMRALVDIGRLLDYRANTFHTVRNSRSQIVRRRQRAPGTVAR